MNHYTQILLIFAVLFIAGIVNECLKQLKQINEKLRDLDFKCEKSARHIENIADEILPLQDSIRSIEKIASQYDTMQPHQFE